MSIETPADRDGIERVSRVVRATLDALAAAVRPGITTAALDGVAARVFARYGARSAPARVYGFPGCVLISVNDEVVHGVPGARALADGDLVKLDVTAELNGFVSDAARSLVVGENTAAAALAACAERAFQAGLRQARAGNRVSAIGRAIDREVRRSGFAVIRELEGHGVGRTIHEPPSVPNYFDPSRRDVLTDNLVITIEPLIAAGRPGVVLGDDGWTVRTRDRSLAAHHEHTILVTRDEPIVLTAA